MPRCGIVILAAGGSSRLGFPKQLVQIDGVTLLRRIVNEAIASSCDPVVVVLGSQVDKLKSEIEDLAVTIAVNDQWQTGVGSSIRRGAAAMLAGDAKVDAVLIALCDQPRITSAIFDRLTHVHFSAGKSICAAEYGGTVGTPAVFSSSLFNELLELPDDVGGRAIIQRNLDDVQRISIPAAEMDLDTPADLETAGCKQLGRSEA